MTLTNEQIFPCIKVVICKVISKQPITKMAGGFYISKQLLQNRVEKTRTMLRRPFLTKQSFHYLYPHLNILLPFYIFSNVQQQNFTPYAVRYTCVDTYWQVNLTFKAYQILVFMSRARHGKQNWEDHYLSTFLCLNLSCKR